MQFHRGRLIDHIHLRVSDVEVSKRFYRAVFASLRLPDILVEGSGFFYADELFVDKAEGYVSRVHLAFQAQDRETVHAFYQAALGAGGKDNGAPGDRSYHPAITVPSSWTPTVTTSKLCFMVPSSAQHRRCCSRQQANSTGGTPTCGLTAEDIEKIGSRDQEGAAGPWTRLRDGLEANRQSSSTDCYR